MKCHNPFQGLIISPASVAFTCINSSFSSCASNYSIRDTFDSGDTSFNDSYFSVDGIGDGGALYCTGTASLNVARCVFDKCNSTADGGSIRMLSRGTFISERSSFQNGKAQKEAGADGKGHMVISNVTSGYHVLDSNIYENGSTTREYTGCCIMFAELAEDFSPSVQLSYCSFHNNTAQNWIPDISTNYQIKANYLNGINCDDCGFSPNCQTLKYSLTRNTLSTNKTIIADTCEFYEDTIAVGTTSIAISGLSRNETVIRSSNGSGYVFTVESGSIAIADCNLKHFEGGEVVLYSFLLMNGNGNIVLNRCDVTCINEQNVIHTSIFDLNGGECVFEDVKITSIRLYDSCIIRNSLGNGVWKLELKESNISRVSRSKRNGSLISGVANTGGSIIFSNCFIEDCSCEDGCGGGLNVRVENEGYFEINSPYSGRTFLNCAAQNGQNLGKGYGGGLFLFLSDDSCAFALKSISFQQCVAEKGKNLFVDANILKNVVNNQTFNFSMDLNDQLAFSGLERSVSNEFTIPLVCFYREFAGSAFVNGSEGMDFSACGFADFPCETIERAVDLHFVGIKRVIVLSSAFSFDHEMEFNGKEYEIGKNDTPVAIHVNASSPKENNGLLSLFLSTSFKGISFILPSSLNGRTSFIISSLSLSESKTEFSVCSFLLSSTEDSSTSLPYSLLSSNGGSVTLTEVSVLDLSFLSCSAFAFHYGTIDISKMVLNGSSTTASTGLLYATEVNLFSFSNTLMTFPTSHRFELIHIDNKSSSLLENNTFMNIWRDNDDGSVMNIEIGNGNVTELKNCSFENCVCSGSLKKGGAIKSCVEEGGSIIIHNCSVSECRVPSEDGFGGGFYLSFVSSSIVYLMKDIIFDKNTANLGDDVYLVIPSPEISITSEKWEGTTKSIEHKEKLWLMDSTPDRSLSASLICFLLKPVDETIYIDNNGIDYERCGWEAVPCESVQYSIDSFVNQLQNIIIQNSTKLETNILMGTTFLQLLGKIEDTEIITNEHGKLNVCGTSTEIVSKIEKLMFTVNFSLSDEFSLIQVQTGKLIVAKCVFGKKSATSSSRWNRWVCNIEGGEVQMESSWIGWASFVSTCGILHIESTGVASLNDVHIISVEGSTDGIITVEEEANALLRCCQMERITLKQGSLISQRKKNLGKYNNENNRIDIEDCSLKEIFQKELLEDINPSILRNEFGAIGQSIFVNNTNFTSCESENSLKGGVLFVEYNEGMNVKISNSIFLLCKAPKGKGGTTYLNCSGEGDLSFEFINDAFHLNDAAVGRDIFVFCTNLDRQINETQFKFNLDQSVYNRSNAIYGRDSLMSADDEDRNLIDLVASYRSDTIFVGDESSGGTSLKMCGSVNSPCLTVNRGLDHLDKSFNSRIVIRENGLIDAECKLEDLQIRSVSKQQASLQFSSGIEKSREYIVCCDGIVEIENQLFSFNTSFLSDHQILFLLKSGETTFISCSFESKAEPSALTVTLPFSLASISLSHSVFDSCSVQCLNFQKPLLECGDSCLFDGYTLKEKANLYEALNGIDEICDWNGSLLSSDNCTLIIHDLEIENSSNGGLQVSGGNVMIEMGMFTNNNPSVENYPSVRRNIHCSDNAQLNVKSLKGGDGILPNTSLWMLNERCIFEGIVSERDSLFFIPVLESVEAKEEANRMKLTFKGLLLVPCNLSFSVVKRKGEEKEIENYDFDSNGYLSEREVEGSVAKDLISSCGNEIEVSVQILFGNSYSPSSTQSFILKNKSVSEPKEDERISEVGNKERSMWPIVVVVMAIVLLIVLIVSIIFIVRWRKQKRRTKELEEIVNDNIKKDPKAFEMVTMEMSPEEQWRKAEREAEKRNEEKMQKRRMCGKKMEHSESSQYLLAECGSTENILLQDSDKIPEWILEKVDEKGEDDISRERTPSPSISSTSTVSTTDTDTTFVRTESLCPTTSSMSNLVDAMACSSPHEKLIVDLRDSLFMLLHGRNEKKEMRIGTQEEREVTAAQVLFWVANGALHSFDDEEVLQSLDNLSPLIVLFSEHMVIAIAFHSDCSEDDSDSDSSSISSSTIVTSSSSYSTSKNGRNSPLPSSAFEDDEDNKKECLRWKAPELLNGDKKHATKKTVVFSIGMMLWECLTLQIPFGEYEPTIAGQKILNGERPNFESVEESIFEKLIKNCVSGSAKVRFALSELKKEFIQYFPHNAAMLTMSDAVDYNVSYVNRSNNQIKQEAGSDTSEF
ncbi:uncharacterized protein MONOS_1256 [Monocercomonoides exilis]|uniref:uncharacterized protein n=1 Tax=Monocercomonoides exilis TaxID=2049356 RepID=UPI00355ACA92|nr:hypothetical protein MONOS_1256 [Monocercomonoides exilis]|eukprot:MONOS_1256.1-p1 / transcript=MONOS_1256.1 / gene=MONOS_1256 / organism=Monocercomonoides_exilis_PA203 / gene_product=unspecified product / transcript_product=unspecified product / location=Mono_scaffold00021:144335-151720(-) / protein_length=2211 / sequence_SO=supercontig / SO=protein_coding / is_pseudo=false